MHVLIAVREALPLPQFLAARPQLDVFLVCFQTLENHLVPDKKRIPATPRIPDPTQDTCRSRVNFAMKVPNRGTDGVLLGSRSNKASLPVV